VRQLGDVASGVGGGGGGGVLAAGSAEALSLWSFAYLQRWLATLAYASIPMPGLFLLTMANDADRQHLFPLSLRARRSIRRYTATLVGGRAMRQAGRSRVGWTHLHGSDPGCRHRMSLAGSVRRRCSCRAPSLRLDSSPSAGHTRPGPWSGPPLSSSRLLGTDGSGFLSRSSRLPAVRGVEAVDKSG